MVDNSAVKRTRACLRLLATAALLTFATPLAQANVDTEPAATSAAGGGSGGLSAECRAFRADAGADLGDVLRAGCEPTLAQMSALMDNPVGNVAMLFNQYDWYQMSNDDAGSQTESQHVFTGIFQFPKSVSDDWNLINRIVYTVPSLPLSQSKIDDFDGFVISPPAGGGPAQPPSVGSLLPINLFSGRTTGFGDMYYVGLLSPKKGIKHGPGKTSVWGVGLDFAFPTASEDILGGGKWSMGPSGLYAYLGEHWKLGGLLQHYVSYTGDGDRDDVNLTNLQYLMYYQVSETMSFGAAPNIIANWEVDSDDRWTVPVGFGVNKTLQFGKVPVRIGVEFMYNVVRPDGVGSDWNFRTYIIPAMPSALFGWMQ